ncbi:MAG TPA: cytochrome c biogenesis protein ResB [Candidatus Limnocylindria bacterium]|nr:cytochrome c biogenesis protein ResB [Candidatus Limnocylindria bacterium]
MKRLLAPLTSIRLTVILLAFGILIIWVGTVAQVDDGLYVAQAKYFRHWIAYPLSLFGHSIPVPLPGGYLLGTALLVNLVAAHLSRFKFSWKKSGIVMTHLGIILLLVGQLATDMFARESRMSFAEGEWRNYSEDFQKTELVFLSDTTDAAMNDVVAIPEAELKPGTDIRIERLPFTVHVKDWFANSEPSFRAPMMKKTNAPQASNGISQTFDFEPVPETHEMEKKNVPTAFVELLGTDGKSLGSWAVSDWSGEEAMAATAGFMWSKQFGSDLGQRIYGLFSKPQTVTAGGRTFTFLLRPTRYYQPFTVKLLKTTHEIYAGTATAADPEGIPKNFQSRVLLDHPTAGRREVDIYMNNPLRFGGLTFFQYQMGREQVAAGRHTSVLQVVKNPSWLTPYVGCGLVALGLVVQFLIHLTAFVRKRKAA